MTYYGGECHGCFRETLDASYTGAVAGAGRQLRSSGGRRARQEIEAWRRESRRWIDCPSVTPDATRLRAGAGAERGATEKCARAGNRVPQETAGNRGSM